MPLTKEGSFSLTSFQFQTIHSIAGTVVVARRVREYLELLVLFLPQDLANFYFDFEVFRFLLIVTILLPRILRLKQCINSFIF